MKGIKPILGLALLCAALSAFSAEPAPETPQDYAFGMALDTQASSSPWYRVRLPPEVYQQSTGSDLRDVRIFNQQGEAVPFSIEVQKPPQKLSVPVAMRVFPLNVSPGVDKNGDGGEHVLLRSTNGIEIHLQGVMASSLEASYLLALPSSVKTSLTVTQLRLSWEKPQGNWQGSASIWAIRGPNTTNGWYKLKSNVPLMDLASNGDRLKLDSIDLQTSMAEHDVRYLLVVLSAQSPRLTGVEATPVGEDVETAQVRLPPDTAQRVSDSEVIWHWKRPQPLTALQITLPADGVLPVVMERRSSANTPWHPLAKEVLYRLDGKTSAAIPLLGGGIEAIRMTSLSAHLPVVLPEVTGLRDSYQLIFNAQGKAPYMLAWGNNAAQSAVLPLDSVIPPALREKHEIASLPEAIPQERVVLGGDARLTATSEAERKSQWQTLLVFGALILGVLVLAGMAWRVWREVKSGKTPL